MQNLISQIPNLVVIVTAICGAVIAICKAIQTHENIVMQLLPTQASNIESKITTIGQDAQTVETTATEVGKVVAEIPVK